MARSRYNDPLTKFLFTVWVFNPITLDTSITRAGFSFLSAPGVATINTRYFEGGAPYNPRIIPNTSRFEPITLSRGKMIDLFQNDEGLFEWMKSLHNSVNFHLQNVPNATTQPNLNINNKYPFRTIIINHHNADGSIGFQYILYNCLPTNLKLGSDFDAMRDDTFSIESLTFEYEGLEQYKPALELSTIRRFL